MLIAATTAAAPEEGALETHLSRLADEAGREVSFREVRSSELIDGEIEITGVFRREPGDRLVRETRQPYREVHRLTATHVEIRKPSGARQRFPLARAPELTVLRHALAAVLDGDAAALREHFEVDFERGAGGWELRLTPADRAVTAKVDSLTLSGREHRIEEMMLRLEGGELFRTEISP